MKGQIEMKQELFFGNWLSAARNEKLEIHEQSWLLAEDGKIKSLGKEKPQVAESVRVHNFGDKLLIPPFSDLHLHAVQAMNCGLGLDLTLLDWLKTYTYPEESRFADPAYAEAVFRRVIHELWKFGSLNSIIFSSLHKEATLLLMKLMQEAGLRAYVGKVNMDRLSPDYLHESAEESLAATREWLEESKAYGALVKPIITPRFAPSCTDQLLEGLGLIVEDYDLPLQSHLNETPEEVALVHELFPRAQNYLEVYEHFGLLPRGKTVMAHCIYNSREEEALLLEKQITIAHCPSSNMNIASGISRIRDYMKEGFLIGLGSDISGGESLSMQQVIKDALKSSALLSRKRKLAVPPLSLNEIFYLATRGGRAFYPESGGFEEGLSCDFLVVDDEVEKLPRQFSLEERLHRFLYYASPEEITTRVLAAEILPEPQL